MNAYIDISCVYFSNCICCHTEEVKITPGNGEIEVPIWRSRDQQSKTNILLHVVDFAGITYR
ncbi:hypothetical protein HYD71_00925 [Mycoplasmopsis bovis]|nr:hypothetical protein [Mycoplasmopsis bovis]QQH49469.1 hypothetical protein HYD71_00925 [Mycoplasmopsis bovis]